MKSRQELVNQALLSLGMRASGQAAAAEDYAAVDLTVEPLLAGLAQRNVWQWGDPDQIDDDAFLTLADLLANQNARLAGSTKDENIAAALEQDLRQLQPVITSGQPQKVDYF